MRWRHALGMVLAFSAAGPLQQRTTVPSPLPRPGATIDALIASADDHYFRRAEMRRGDTANPDQIDRAIAGYQEAILRDRESLEARWKLMRALYFKGADTGLESRASEGVFNQARIQAVETMAILSRKVEAGSARKLADLAPKERADAVRRIPDAGEIYFWSAVSWGEWALRHGKLEAARQGAASTVRDDCEVVIALDPTLEDAGGYRVLGRLHAESPWIPFLTGWVSRQKAIEYLSDAVRIAPDNAINRLFLAEALWQYAPQRRSEAVDLLKKMIGELPSPSHLIEFLRAQDAARRDLEKWEAAPG